MLLDGKTTEFAPLILFSPRKPRFRRRVRSSQGVAVAAHVRRRDGKFYLDGGQRSPAHYVRPRVFPR